LLKLLFMNEIKIIEDKIKIIIEEEGNTVSFKYDWINPQKPPIGQLVDARFDGRMLAEIKALTHNKQTNETFLLKSISADTHVQCLLKILEYLEHTKKNMNTYTVNWSRIENGVVGTYNTSHFYCHDVIEVVNKFFINKNTWNYIIYDIKLNPVS
jgi:hypothetical protein